MGDLDRSGSGFEEQTDVTLTNPELKKQWLLIKKNEKEVQLKQLEIYIDRVERIDLPKAVHARDKCKKELELLIARIDKAFIEIEHKTNDKKQGGK